MSRCECLHLSPTLKDVFRTKRNYPPPNAGVCLGSRLDYYLKKKIIIEQAATVAPDRSGSGLFFFLSRCSCVLAEFLPKWKNTHVNKPFLESCTSFFPRAELARSFSKPRRARAHTRARTLAVGRRKRAERTESFWHIITTCSPSGSAHISIPKQPLHTHAHTCKQEKEIRFAYLCNI